MTNLLATTTTQVHLNTVHLYWIFLNNGMDIRSPIGQLGFKSGGYSMLLYLKGILTNQIAPFASYIK